MKFSDLKMLNRSCTIVAQLLQAPNIENKYVLKLERYEELENKLKTI